MYCHGYLPNTWFEINDNFYDFKKLAKIISINLIPKIENSAKLGNYRIEKNLDQIWLVLRFLNRNYNFKNYMHNSTKSKVLSLS